MDIQLYFILFYLCDPLMKFYKIITFIYLF